uniref:BUD22 domain-containing protein n=1 Tax=Rhabditophanes sp. KR3021 TaxID=114890 RepID=A0AC35UEK0_9BILA
MADNNKEDLKNNKHKLEQIELALSTEPNNANLLRIKTDLLEVIELLEEILEDEEADIVANKKEAPGNDKAKGAPTEAKSAQLPSTSSDKADPKKSKKFHEGLSHRERNKKQWEVERDKKRQKQMKRDEKQKELETTKEKEKNSWQNFNNKANAKNLKGVKRIGGVISTSDALRGSKVVKKDMNNIRSTQANNTFGSVQRGNMDSLF